jgi:hypothetical protein
MTNTRKFDISALKFPILLATTPKKDVVSSKVRPLQLQMGA